MIQKYIFFFYLQGILSEKSMMPVMMVMAVTVRGVKILWPMNEFGAVDPFGQPIKEDCRNPSS